MPFPEDLDPLLRPWLDEHTPTASDFAQAQKRAARVLSALQRDPDAGVLESLNGLHPPTSGVQVRFGEDGSSVSDIESAGAVGGYWILNVSSHEAAVEWARRCPALPGDVLELRQIQEMDDFPEDVQDVVAGYDL